MAAAAAALLSKSLTPTAADVAANFAAIAACTEAARLSAAAADAAIVISGDAIGGKPAGAGKLANG